MARAPTEPDPNELPREIGRPAQRALAGAGISRLQDLTQCSEAALRRLHGVGPRAITVLRAALAARGWSFGTPEGMAEDRSRAN